MNFHIEFGFGDFGDASTFVPVNNPLATTGNAGVEFDLSGILQSTIEGDLYSDPDLEDNVSENQDTTKNWMFRLDEGMTLQSLTGSIATLRKNVPPYLRLNTFAPYNPATNLDITFRIDLNDGNGQQDYAVVLPGGTNLSADDLVGQFNALFSANANLNGVVIAYKNSSQSGAEQLHIGLVAEGEDKYLGVQKDINDFSIGFSTGSGQEGGFSFPPGDLFLVYSEGYSDTARSTMARFGGTVGGQFGLTLADFERISAADATQQIWQYRQNLTRAYSFYSGTALNTESLLRNIGRFDSTGASRLLYDMEFTVHLDSDTFFGSSATDQAVLARLAALEAEVDDLENRIATGQIRTEVDVLSSMAQARGIARTDKVFALREHPNGTVEVATDTVEQFKQI